MKPEIPYPKVPQHGRLRPDHVGVYDDVVLASDYWELRAAFVDFVQAVLDPENQPSQYGTTLIEHSSKSGGQE